MKISGKARHAAKQLYLLCLVGGLLDENRIRQVVQHVIASDRRLGPSTLRHFLRLVKLDRARHTAIVQSASPLPADLQNEVQDELAHRYGPGLSTAFSQRPELIGGIRIQVGCDVYDGSVKAGLNALERSF